MTDRGRHRRATHLVALVAAASWLVACGDDAAPDATSGGSETVATTGSADVTTETSPASSAPAGEVTSLGSLLSVAPAIDAGEGAVYLTYGDLDAVSELLGVARPRDAGDDEIVHWAMGLTLDASDDGSQVAVAMLPRLATVSGARSAEMAAELGWNLGDVAAFLEISALPEEVTLVTGDVSVDDLDAVAPRSGDLWQVGEGDDFSAQIDQVSPVRPTGAPLHLAWRDGVVAVSRSTAAATAFAAGSPTLLESEPALAAVAAPLIALDPHGALLGRPGEAGDWYDAWALGQAVDGEQRIGMFVYHPAADVTAEALAAAVEERLAADTPHRADAPWLDVFPGTTVRVDGDVVVITMPLSPTTAPDLLWVAVQIGGQPLPN